MLPFPSLSLFLIADDLAWVHISSQNSLRLMSKSLSIDARTPALIPPY